MIKIDKIESWWLWLDCQVRVKSIRDNPALVKNNLTDAVNYDDCIT